MDRGAWRATVHGVANSETMEWLSTYMLWGFPWSSVAKNPLSMQETWFHPWVRKILWRREWQPTPVFLPGESHGQRAWWAGVHRTTKGWTRPKRLSTHALEATQSFQAALVVKNPPANAGDRAAGLTTGWGRSQEEGMATHSSILAWRSPWTEEPHGLQSMGLQRVGHTYPPHTHTCLQPSTNFIKEKFSSHWKVVLHMCVCVFVKWQNDSYFSNPFIMNHFK